LIGEWLNAKRGKSTMDGKIVSKNEIIGYFNS